MERRLLINGTRSRFSETEARLMHFADRAPESRSDRLLRAQDKIRQEQDQRLQMSGDLSSRLDARRVNAPVVDDKHTKAVLTAERASFLMGDTVEGRRYQGAVQKALAMEEQYKTERDDAGVPYLAGIKFGNAGDELTILEGDEVFIGWAIGKILGQQRENIRPQDDPATEHTWNPARESKEEFNDRMNDLRKDNAQYERNLLKRGMSENEEWDMLKKALLNYKNTFHATKKLVETVKKNPRAINGPEFTDKWKSENLKIYKQALKDAAIVDVAVLQGKERDFTRADYLQILKEVQKKNPMALQYYPEDVKQANPDSYRKALIEGAKITGAVIGIALVEYELFWKGNEKQYRELCTNAINKDPQVFFTQNVWLRGNKAENLRLIADGLSLKTKMEILKGMGAGTLSAFDGLEGKYTGFIKSMLATTERDNVLITVANKSVLWMMIDTTDTALMREMSDGIRSSKNPDVRALLKLPHIGSNEKTGASVLKDLVRDIMIDPSKAESILRERSQELESIPDVAWRANEAFALQLFAKQGELLRYAPNFMRSEKQWGMKIMRVNASAHKMLSEDLRNDPEVLYPALLSDAAGRGELDWKWVGKMLKFRLMIRDIDGIPSTDDLLRVLILRIGKKEAPLTAALVDSLIDDWTDDMKRDATLVEPYLLRHADHPEYFLDVGNLLRLDMNFINTIVKKIPGVFAHIDHAVLSKADPEAYFKLAADMSVKHLDLFSKIPEALRKDPTFIAEVSKRIPPKPSGTPPPPTPKLPKKP